MPKPFPVGTLEIAWTRRVLCAAEIVDAVTLEPVTTGIKVRADGLKRKPQVNWSGFHYWLEEGAAQPQRIVVTSQDDRYSETESVPPVPPEKAIRIELPPRPSYPFPPGATVVRGTLLVSRFGDRQPIAGATVRLQWSDGPFWINASTAVKTDERGDFAAPLRLGPKDDPRMIGGGMAVRLRVSRDGLTRTGDEFALPPRKISPQPQPFIWDDLHP